MMEITRKSIFGGERQENISKQDIVELELDKLISYRGAQPFSSLNEAKKSELLNSIQRNGVMDAIIVRALGNDKYEVLAGHNRVDCCKKLNKKTIPSRIVEVDDDLAEFIMLETNLCRREELLPVEKGKAYKQQLYLIMKNRKSDDQSGHLNSITELASISEDSKTQIQRYIRLTNLIFELQDKVNKGILPLGAGVELSYVSEEEQTIINRLLEVGNITLSITQAEELRSKKGTLDEEEILKILTGVSLKAKSKNEFKFTGKIKKKTINKYRDRFNDNNEFNDLIEKLLDEYFNKQN